MRDCTQPAEPELYIATVAVAVLPGQRVMYPLWPYHAAWNPGTPDGTLAGGGMPGPTLEVQVSLRSLFGGAESAAVAGRAGAVKTNAMAKHITRLSARIKTSSSK
jgi:hypothetical protein